MTNKKVAILIPTYNSTSAKLFDQWIQLGAWAEKNNIKVISVYNRTHNDARNWLATGGAGFMNPDLMLSLFDTFVWIDSDMKFDVNQVESLIQHDHPFVSGVYYKTDDTNTIKEVMAARWDEEKFLMTGRMDYLKEDEIKRAKNPIQVSYCGFGFCKTDTSLFKKMAYPYFTNKRVTIEKEKQSFTENASEDVSFCLDSPVKPVIDPNIVLGHVKEYIL